MVELKYVLYKDHSPLWPETGPHILASYDESSIVVYAAFCPSIAEAAVKNQKFIDGAGGFRYGRMTWVKPNFLWMMYRSGWARKQNQERILAIHITLTSFRKILQHAYTGQSQKKAGLERVLVRLQWDPDHSPSGLPLSRKAIQLGMRDEMLQEFCNDMIVKIEDITDFVQKQGHFVDSKQMDKLMVPEHQVFTVDDGLAKHLEMECL